MTSAADGAKRPSGFVRSKPSATTMLTWTQMGRGRSTAGRGASGDRSAYGTSASAAPPAASGSGGRNAASTERRQLPEKVTPQGKPRKLNGS